MIIGIDANEANVTNRVGIGQWAFHILTHIYKLDQKNTYFIYLKNKPLSDLPKQKSNWQYKVIGPEKLWTKIALPLNLFLSSPKPDIFVSLSHYSPTICPCPTIPSIMDLGYLKYPNQFTKKDLYQLTNWTQKSISKASKIITISKFSQEELQKKYQINPNKIIIAPPASNPLKTSLKTDQQILSKYNIKKPYFLYLGTLKPSKNIPFLLNAFSTFIKYHSTRELKNQSTIVPEYQLVIAGKKGWLFDDIFATVKKLNLEKNVVFTDYFQDSHKWSFYKQAAALVIPSLYEGFGMPALEAMSVGTPVIGSNITSIPEVIGNAGILVDPANTRDLVKALKIIAKPITRQSLSKLSLIQSQKYSWVKSAQTIIDSLSSI